MKHHNLRHSAQRIFFFISENESFWVPGITFRCWCRRHRQVAIRKPAVIHHLWLPRGHRLLALVAAVFSIGWDRWRRFGIDTDAELAQKLLRNFEWRWPSSGNNGCKNAWREAWKVSPKLSSDLFPFSALLKKFILQSLKIKSVFPARKYLFVWFLRKKRKVRRLKSKLWFYF